MTARVLAIALLFPLATYSDDPPPAKPKPTRVTAKPKTEPKEPPAKKLPAINELIISGCKLNLEKKIGDGESASLAVFALKQCGARPKGVDYPDKDDFTWGALIYRMEGKDKSEMGKLVDVLPGDIVQLRDAKFKGFKVNHHTAIVRSVNDEKATIGVWEQRGRENKDVVLEGEYILSEMAEGWIRVYRPVAK